MLFMLGKTLMFMGMLGQIVVGADAAFAEIIFCVPEHERIAFPDGFVEFSGEAHEISGEAYDKIQEKIQEKKERESEEGESEELSAEEAARLDASYYSMQGILEASRKLN